MQSRAVAAAACWALFAVGSPQASADPGTDALGFVDSAARCAAPDTAAAFGSTASSRVAVCKLPSGAFEYRGVRISDGAKLIAPASADADGSYLAKSAGFTYTVNSHALVVSSGTQVLRREPMVSFHGPQTAQTPAATPQTPAAPPTTPPGSAGPTTPLPPPLPAEVGGKR